jgi:hypothetical protein
MAIHEKILSQRSEIGASVPRESSPNASAGTSVQFRNRRIILEEPSRPPPLTFKLTPLPAAGVADHIWSLEEIAALLE